MSTTELFIRGFAAVLAIMLFGCTVIGLGLGLVTKLFGAMVIAACVLALLIVTKGYT